MGEEYVLKNKDHKDEFQNEKHIGLKKIKKILFLICEWFITLIIGILYLTIFIILAFTAIVISYHIIKYILVSVYYQSQL